MGMLLGLPACVLGAVGTARGTGDEVPVSFSQVGEPNRHPGDLIETKMAGAVIDTDERGPGGSKIATGKIVYHESHLVGADVDMTFAVDSDSGFLSTEGLAAQLNFTVAKSNDSGCPVGSAGHIIFSHHQKAVSMTLFVCGKVYNYTAQISKNSRLHLSVGSEKRCLTALPNCPQPPGTGGATTTTTASTTATTTTTAAAPSGATKVMLSVDGDVCTQLLIPNAPAPTCTEGYETDSNWYLKVPDAAQVVTASVNGPLPPGDSIQINGSPAPLCVAKPPKQSCSATFQPNPNAPTAVGISFVTAYGGGGPSLALVWSP
jgi:hypothetical protein